MHDQIIHTTHAAYAVISRNGFQIAAYGHTVFETDINMPFSQILISAKDHPLSVAYLISWYQFMSLHVSLVLFMCLGSKQW